MFIPYKKIHRIGKSEVEWILDRPVLIQEKIDWANTSIWMNGSVLMMWSRTQIIYDWWILKSFRWFQEYILQHTGIMKLLSDHPNYRLFWEWLCKHTIIYPEEYFNHFYLFDIMDWDAMLDPAIVLEIANTYWIKAPHIFWYGKYSYEEIMEYVWSQIKQVPWEWVVIKSLDFVNKYWDNYYAKIIHEQFREENSIIFGNYHKSDIEMKFVSQYITPNRVQKIVNKIEQNEWRNIIIQDTPKVMGMVLYDAFSEEMRWYSSNRIIDMWRLKNLSNKRTRLIFHKYLETGEFMQWFDALLSNENNDV